MSVPDDEAAELANDLAIANAQVKWMEAENERLQAALDHDAMMHRDEIEQMRADVKRWRWAYEDARAIASAALRALEQARKE